MDTYKMGEYVYHTTNPELSGTIVGYNQETYIVRTKGGDVNWHPSIFTTDYHLIIKQLLEDLGEMKEAFFRQKDLLNKK
tara:strand:+ start:353 stop:589 length:237 start_codon:yes stop_codon:yes gene_type:complete